MSKKSWLLLGGGVVLAVAVVGSCMTSQGSGPAGGESSAPAAPAVATAPPVKEDFTGLPSPSICDTTPLPTYCVNYDLEGCFSAVQSTAANHDNNTALCAARVACGHDDGRACTEFGHLYGALFKDDVEGAFAISDRGCMHNQPEACLDAAKLGMAYGAKLHGQLGIDFRRKAELPLLDACRSVDATACKELAFHVRKGDLSPAGAMDGEALLKRLCDEKPRQLIGWGLTAVCTAVSQHDKLAPQMQGCTQGDGAACGALLQPRLNGRPGSQAQAELQTFARAGCLARDCQSCVALADFAPAADTAAQAQQVCSAACDGSDAKVAGPACRILGRREVEQGNASGGIHHLTRACTLGDATGCDAMAGHYGLTTLLSGAAESTAAAEVESACASRRKEGHACDGPGWRHQLRELGASCDKGQAAACRQVGRLAMDWASCTEARPWLDKACAAGDGSGCAELARCQGGGQSEHGRDEAALHQTIERAKKQCADGNAESCAALSDLLHEGDAIDQSLTQSTGFGARATELATAACNAGQGNQCLHLARWTLDGVFADRDEAKSLGLLTQGCNAKDAGACSALGRFLLDNKGPLGDAAKGRAALVSGCQLGDGDGCRNLRHRLQKNEWPGPEAQAARDTVDHACARGLTAACAK